MTFSCRTDTPGPALGKRRGFTLVEMLVAVTIAALILVLLVNVISRALQVSQHSSESMAAFSAGSAAIDLIAADIASTAVTRQPAEYLQAYPDPTFPLATYPKLYAGTSPPMLLMLEIVSPQDSSRVSSGVYVDSGQVRAVCYRIAWQNPLAIPGATVNASTSIFGLYRQVVSAADTFQNVLGKTDIYAALYANTSWVSADPAANPATTPPATPPVTGEFVAGNLVDLQVAFYANPVTTSGTGIQTVGLPAVIINPVGGAAPSPSPPYQRVQILGTSTLVNNPEPAPASPSPLAGYTTPSYAEVSLTVIESSAAKLWADGSGTGRTSPAALKQKYGHTLTRKVVLRTPE